MMRALPLPIVVLLAVAFGVLALSCAGERLTDEDYFRQLETLVVDVDEQVEALGQETFGDVDASSTFQDQIAASQVFYPGYLEIVEQFQDGIEELEPPVAAEAVHNEFVAAGDDFLAILQTISDQIAGVSSEAELAAVFEDDFAELDDRIEQACFDAQAIADEHNVAVDLNCALD